MYRRQRFSGGCGRSFGGSRMEPRAPIAKWHERLDSPRRCVRWRGRARRIRCRWWCRAIAWCVGMASLPVIVGEWRGSRRCWSTNLRVRERNKRRRREPESFANRLAGVLLDKFKDAGLRPAVQISTASGSTDYKGHLRFERVAAYLLGLRFAHLRE